MIIPNVWKNIKCSKPPTSFYTDIFTRRNRSRHNLLQALLHSAVKLIPLAFPINLFWLAIALPWESQLALPRQVRMTKPTWWPGDRELRVRVWTWVNVCLRVAVEIPNYHSTTCFDGHWTVAKDLRLLNTRETQHINTFPLQIVLHININP